MEDLIELYVDLCKRVGGLGNLVQGAGGNISVKNNDILVIKASGTRVSDEEYVVLDRKAKKVIAGSGKPSIETCLHSLEPKIIVHLHPASLMNRLCDVKENTYIPYYKPGQELANALQKVFLPEQKIYFFQNHGILVHGDSVEEVVKTLGSVDETFAFSNLVYEFGKEKFGKQLYIKDSVFPKVFSFTPFTPDLCVFLQFKPLHYLNYDSLESYVKENGCMPTVIYFEDKTFVLGKTLMNCYDIIEILTLYFQIEKGKKCLTDTECKELITWDAEKERLSMRQ